MVNTSMGGFIRHQFEKNSQEEFRNDLITLYPRLWRYCVVKTGSRHLGDDLAQATCLRALEKQHHFKPGTHMDRWLFTMAHRLWLNDLRRTHVKQAGDFISLDDIELPATGCDTETNILARQVLNQISGLPEAMRDTVMLVYVEGLSYKEAADILDIPIGTIMSRLSSARKKLNELLPIEKGSTA